MASVMRGGVSLPALAFWLAVLCVPGGGRSLVGHQPSSLGPFCLYAWDYISYCLEFLTSTYYRPDTKCCNHVAKLNAIARHREENPRLLCFCIEYSIRGTQPPVLADRIQALPLLCHTHLSFPISSSMDCSRVV